MVIIIVLIIVQGHEAEIAESGDKCLPTAPIPLLSALLLAVTIVWDSPGTWSQRVKRTVQWQRSHLSCSSSYLSCSAPHPVNLLVIWPSTFFWLMIFINFTRKQCLTVSWPDTSHFFLPTRMCLLVHEGASPALPPLPAEEGIFPPLSSCIKILPALPSPLPNLEQSESYSSDWYKFQIIFHVTFCPGLDYRVLQGQTHLSTPLPSPYG